MFAPTVKTVVQIAILHARNTRYELWASFYSAGTFTPQEIVRLVAHKNSGLNRQTELASVMSKNLQDSDLANVKVVG